MREFIEVWKPRGKSNPIFFAVASNKTDTGWYFWDKDWLQTYGPYVSLSEAKDALFNYGLSFVKDLLDKNSDPEYNDWNEAVFSQAEAE